MTWGGNSPTTKPNMETHHLDYERIGNEEFGDLIVVCSDCHRLLHEFIKKLVGKGFGREAVMRRMKFCCQRRLIRIHKDWRHNAFK